MNRSFQDYCSGLFLCMRRAKQRILGPYSGLERTLTLEPTASRLVDLPVRSSSSPLGMAASTVALASFSIETSRYRPPYGKQNGRQETQTTVRSSDLAASLLVLQRQTAQDFAGPIDWHELIHCVCWKWLANKFECRRSGSNIGQRALMASLRIKNARLSRAKLAYLRTGVLAYWRVDGPIPCFGIMSA